MTLFILLLAIDVRLDGNLATYTDRVFMSEVDCIIVGSEKLKHPQVKEIACWSVKLARTETRK